MMNIKTTPSARTGTKPTEDILIVKGNPFREKATLEWKTGRGAAWIMNNIHGGLSPTTIIDVEHVDEMEELIKKDNLLVKVR